MVQPRNFTLLQKHQISIHMEIVNSEFTPPEAPDFDSYLIIVITSIGFLLVTLDTSNSDLSCRI